MDDGDTPVDGDLFCPNFYELVFTDGSNASLPKALPSIMDDFERGFISWALEKCGGNQGKAASLLGIPRTTLQSKLRVLKIEKQGTRKSLPCEKSTGSCSENGAIQ